MESHSIISPLTKTIHLVKYLRFCLFLVLLTLGLSNQAYGKPNKKLIIAVEELIPNGVQGSDARIISNRLRTELINTNTFRVMERSQMDVILREQGFQHSGVCNSSECLVEVGQILGVDRIIAGSVGHLGDLYTINARMLNVETSEIIFSVNEDYPGSISELLVKSIPALAYKMSVEAKQNIAQGEIEEKSGMLFIKSSIPRATITIDDNELNSITPVTLKNFPAGEHHIVVQHKNYFGTKVIDLPPNKLLKVNINMFEGYGEILINSTPPEAGVYLGDSLLGKTPVHIEKIPIGEHQLYLQKLGFMRSDLPIEVEMGKLTEAESVLQPAAYISISPKSALFHQSLPTQFSENRSATLTINNKNERYQIGSTAKVPAGSIFVQLTLPDHEQFLDTFYLKQNHKRHMKPNLHYNYGVMQLNCKNVNAEVWLNDQKMGLTPLTLEKVPIGNQDLRLQALGWAPYNQTFTIKSNQLLTQNISLERSLAWKDSIAQMEANRLAESLRIKRRNTRLISGLFMTAGAGLSVYYHNELELERENAEIASKNYEKAHTDFKLYKTAYSNAQNRADEAILKRNTAIVISVLGATGIGWSFTF